MKLHKNIKTAVYTSIFRFLKIQIPRLSFINISNILKSFRENIRKNKMALYCVGTIYSYMTEFVKFFKNACSYILLLLVVKTKVCTIQGYS